MATRQFNIEKQPYEEDITIYKKSTIELQSGVTVLVGCNGSGKTTLLHTIEQQLKSQGIPMLYFDNNRDGGANVASKAFYDGDMSLGATALCSSEGETIGLFAGQMAQQIGAFTRSSKVKKSKEFWILIDALDSGWSIDNVDEVKKYLFDLIIETNNDKDVYIVVSANAYEMCRESNCFDVIRGSYKTFKTYESYRKFILKTREIKDKRYD